MGLGSQRVATARRDARGGLMPRGTPTEIAYWLGTQRVVPSAWELMQVWDLSRAAAFRWRAFARSGGRCQQRHHAAGKPKTK